MVEPSQVDTDSDPNSLKSRATRILSTLQSSPALKVLHGGKRCLARFGGPFTSSPEYIFLARTQSPFHGVLNADGEAGPHTRSRMLGARPHGKEGESAHPVSSRFAEPAFHGTPTESQGQG